VSGQGSIVDEFGKFLKSGIGQRVQQAITIGEVPVQRHRRDADGLGDATHRNSVRTLAIQ
jgi:hypothetical protein